MTGLRECPCRASASAVPTSSSVRHQGANLGAEGEVRTRTGLPPAVFKTAASAASATSARSCSGRGHRSDQEPQSGAARSTEPLRVVWPRPAPGCLRRRLSGTRPRGVHQPECATDPGLHHRTSDDELAAQQGPEPCGHLRSRDSRCEGFGVELPHPGPECCRDPRREGTAPNVGFVVHGVHRVTCLAPWRLGSIVLRSGMGRNR